MRLREIDDQVTYVQQLQQEEDGPVVLINQFNLAPGDAGQFPELWAVDAAFMKKQPGFISTQLHRGTAGSTTYVNVAVWESAQLPSRVCG
jgi:quinol monooxygenase YgiN